MIKKLLAFSLTLCAGFSLAQQNPGLVISELLVNPGGTDSPFEWVELLATDNIDFSTTPYSVVVTSSDPATTNGWIEGGSITYGFALTSGTVNAGDVVYVGGSSMSPTGTQLRAINTATTAGDGFGNAGSGVFGNGGGNADGIAVFNVAIGSITASTVPVDALFYGSSAGASEVNGGTDGYELPVNDFYNGGKFQASSTLGPDPGGDDILHASGSFNTATNSWIGQRNWTIESTFTDQASEISLTTVIPPGLVSVSSDVQIVSEADGTIGVDVEIVNANASEARVIFGLSVWTDATEGSDFDIPNDTLVIPANTNGTFTLPIILTDDLDAEKTERIVLRIVDTINCQVSGNDYQIIFVKDNDYVAPVATNQLNLSLLTSFSNGSEGVTSAEIVTFDSTTNRLYIANSVGSTMDVVDFSNPASPTLLNSIDISTYGGINSVTSHNGIVAAAIENNDPQQNGFIVFFDADGTYLNQVTVGAMPDMITFNRDHTRILTANEGEPSSDYLDDPEGSISIVNLAAGISALTNSDVTMVDFTAYNSQSAALIAQGIRIFPQAASVAQDMEPEYIAISEDNTTAYVSIQEQNALAVVDIANGTITELRALGLSDYAAGNNALDPSNQSGDILIQSLPVKGAYMPDAIAYSTIGGNGYVFTANEGDARENDLIEDADRIANMNLDPAAFADQDILKNNKFLGRLNALQVTGDTDNDGDFDELQVLGGRSFSIWDAQTGNLVFDSKDLIEQIIAADPVYVNMFNASNEGGITVKNRSDDKGPEPEGVTTATIDGNHFVFVSLERIGGVMVFNVNNPAQPKYVGYHNNRDLATDGPDRGAEGIIFISAEASPNGNALVILANEVSSTLSVYQVNSCLELAGATTLSGGSAFCAGDSTLLAFTAESGTTSEWLLNGNAISGTDNDSLYVSQAGQYALVVSNQTYGCSDTTSAIQITENALPVVDLGADTTLCEYNAPLTLDAGNNGSDFNWSNGENTQTVAVSTAGTFSVSVSDTNGCMAFDEITVNLDPCLGLEETQLSVSVYPNPFTGQLFIRSEAAGSMAISLYDLRGDAIVSMNSPVNETGLDLDLLAPGIYMLRLTQNGQTTILKVQKQ